jgi:hypothetical protein
MQHVVVHLRPRENVYGGACKRSTWYGVKVTNPQASVFHLIASGPLGSLHSELQCISGVETPIQLQVETEFDV